MDNENGYSYMIDGKPACVSLKAVLLCMCSECNFSYNVQFLIVLHTRTV
jgi:hypothetical protein